MDLKPDHNVKLKNFDNAQSELVEIKKDYSVLHPDVGRFESKFYVPQQSNPNDLSESSKESINEEKVQRKKVYLKSAVIPKRRKLHSRKDVINKQNLNHKVQIRNCRILGMLQNTLQKFKDDAEKRQPQDMKRKRLEQKIEATNQDCRLKREKAELLPRKKAKKLELDYLKKMMVITKSDMKRKRLEQKTEATNQDCRLKREKAELLLRKKAKKLELDYLEKTMAITKSFEAWKSKEECLLKYIITKTKPHICYLPLSHTPSSEKLLQKSRTEVQKNIRRKEEAVQIKLAKIKDYYHVSIRSNQVL